MGPHTDLDRFTDSELCQMQLDAYRRSMEHFQNAERIYGRMLGMATWTPEYAAEKQAAKTALEAGTEAHELHSEISATLTARRSNANA